MEQSQFEQLLAQLTTDDLRALDVLLHKHLAQLETPPVVAVEVPRLPAPVQPAAPPIKPPPVLKYPTAIGDALVGAAYRVLTPGKRDKRHLTKGYGLTLCNRAIERGVKAERKYDAEDCRTCLQFARKKRLTCKSCGQPLLRAADKRICAACVKAKAAAKRAPRRRPAVAPIVPAGPSPWPSYPADRQIIPMPGQNPLAALDQVLARDRVGWAFDDLLFHEPSPVPPTVTIGREWVGPRLRYTFCVPVIGFLGHLLLPVTGAGQAYVEAQVAGHPDDPATAERQTLFTPIALALEARMLQHEHRKLDTSPEAMQRIFATNVIIHQPAHRDPSQVAYRLAPCAACGAPAAQHIFAEYGTLEDNARMMFEPIRKANVPTWIIDVSQREDAEDERPVDRLQVWPTRGERTSMPFAETEALLDAVCCSHCPQ